MYARSTTVTADPGKVEDGLAFVRDHVVPAVQQMDGFVGLSMLADRSSGRSIVTAAWRDREAMDATADRVAEMRRRAADVFGGEPEVAEWEVAVMHRVRPAGEGAGTRVIWGRVDPESLDRAVDTLTTAVVPRLEEIPGFCSMSTVVDRATGRMATAATYESRDALEASRERGSALRQEFTQAMNAEIIEVAEFDLVLAQLRVPESM